MRLSLCIVSAQPELAKNAVRHAVTNASGPLDVYVFGNGWTDDQAADFRSFLSRVEGRNGAPPALEALELEHVHENGLVSTGLHRLYEMAKRGDVEAADDHVLVYIHDDVDILEPRWDERVRNRFLAQPDIGLAGFACALGLGEDAIYKAPYELRHVGRHTFGSNMVGATIHGFVTTEDREAASPDGFSMIIRRSLLDKIGGWSWFPFLHHVYDYAIACQARRHGYRCWLIPVHVNHHGGKTACGPIHQETAKKYGGDTQVHADAHRWLYDNFRDVLPFKV
jgi:GT2 family glycosyltransferase